MAIGRFYFKLTPNGNLLGEYSNDRTTRCYAEAAQRQVPEGGADPEPHQFVGTYDSVWIEEEGVRSARLRIETREGAVGIFTVDWNVADGSDFGGEGMLCDEALIGNYWSVRAQ